MFRSLFQKKPNLYEGPTTYDVKNEPRGLKTTNYYEVGQDPKQTYTSDRWKHLQDETK